MRNLLTFATGLTLLAASGCTDGPGVLADPPLLTVTSPARSLVQDHTGKLSVTGTVTPNAQGDAVKSVTVNGVTAILNADGTFSAQVDVQPGASLIQTVATDVKGTVATDTRSVEAGELRTPGQMLPSAIAADLSPQAFAKISDLAGTMIKAEDFTKLLAPMQPMLNTGGSCLGAKVYVDSLTMTDAHISLVPVDGGLSFSLEVDGLDVNSHADYHVACIGGSDTFEITADAVYVSGTLNVAPNGMMGFTTTLVSPNVNITNLNVSASGLPGAILDLIDMNGLISTVISKGAEMFMGPMMNKALGALAGPKMLSLGGKQITFQISPSDVEFTPSAGLVVLDTQIAIGGTEAAKFVFTPNGSPTLNPGMGMQLGLADDLANDMMSQITTLGMLNLSMPTTGGTFDSATMAATSPPMISADPADGKMRMILPDMKVTFTQAGTPVASAALNAKIALDVAPASNGSAIAIQLGKPEIDIDVTDDIPNETRFTKDDLGKAVELALQSQIASISALLGGIPLPAMDGLQMSNLSMGADSGYVMVKGDLK
ncbi:MAG: hypothetical protein ACM31C_09705 [Acidobacteriota bacterium]